MSSSKGTTGEGSAWDQPDRNPRPDILRAPWRDQYMRTLEQARLIKERPASGKEPAALVDAGSFLGAYWQRPDEDAQNHVIVRLGDGATGGMILLNRYPYANGHLLVALGEARPRLLEYEPTQRAALWGLIELAWALMERTLRPQGINVGINEGVAAGAGVPQHLHAHLVPRWRADVNFISVVGGVRVIPSALDVMAARYREAWAAMQAAREM